MPFYSATQRPQAPCPYCSLEKGDFRNQTLYRLNGLSEGEYDNEIPKEFFQIPPTKLGGDDPGLQALAVRPGFFL